MSTTPDASVTIATRGPLDLPRTVAPVRHGPGDPSMRIGPNGIWRATRTSAGPLTMRLRLRGEVLTIDAWGPGAALVASIGPRLAGQEDDPSALVPQHRLIRDLAHRHTGLRLAATGNVWDALAPAIIEQKVTGTEAFRAWRLLVTAHGERAPGPPGLLVPPTPATIGGLPYHAFHRFGIERRRADTLRRAAALGERLEALTDAAATQGALLPIPGIGPWTLAEVNRVAFGDADAVSVGDFHIPNLVSWALAGEARGDDARMLELLEPYRGQRGRIQRLLEVSGIRAPRYGPRLAPRSIATI
jgi:3-methyladenine DNA glycosylase/8-oxoguanine DNA glycosylase